MCNECVRDSIIKNAKTVLGLDLQHLTYEQIDEISKKIKQALIESKINVNDHRQACMDLFKREFSNHR